MLQTTQLLQSRQVLRDMGQLHLSSSVTVQDSPHQHLLLLQQEVKLYQCWSLLLFCSLAVGTVLALGVCSSKVDDSDLAELLGIVLSVTG